VLLTLCINGKTMLEEIHLVPVEVGKNIKYVVDVTIDGYADKSKTSSSY
tara:strand:- start:1160 stop:1306 length:147 start_codon:yes stop_codon:yes gene_type:complete